MYPKRNPTFGSLHTACPSMSPIIDESQVLPLLPDPKIHTMFPGLMTPAPVSVPLPAGLPRNSSSLCRVRPTSNFRYALTPRATSTTMSFLNAGIRSPFFSLQPYLWSRGQNSNKHQRRWTAGRNLMGPSTRAIELFEQGGGHLLDDPSLLWGQVILPAPGGGLAVELALPLLLFGEVLPRVLLHHPG